MKPYRNYKHGMAPSKGKSREYRTWQSMKARCCNPRVKAFHRYGGIGITVCPEWAGSDSFPQFLADMGTCPDGYELDRIDNSKGYSPDNCRWVSNATQARNRKCVKLDMEKARAIRKDPRSLNALAKEYGVTKGAIQAVKNGWIWKEEVTNLETLNTQTF